MSDHEYKTEQGSTRGSTGDRSMGFDCCGIGMGDAVAESRCGSIMRRHPVVTTAFLGVVGLAVLVIPVGAILGIIAFFRTV